MALLGNLKGSSQVFQDTEFYNGVATQSLRLDGGAEITLDNAGSATSNKIATISTWFKRADETTVLAYLFHSKNDGSFGDGSNGLASFSITLDADDNISVVQYNGNPSFNANQYDFGVKTSGRKFRDVGSWYHLVVAIDTTQGSGTTNEADRIKMYINGDQQTVVAINDGSGYQDFADENQLIAVNQDGEQRWGGSVDDSVYAHVYLAETNVVDGLALDASYFGETKNGVWIAKAPNVSEYGNHGYRLQYKETSVGSGSSSTIGADTSGKNNHFTSTNVSAHDCNMPDSPENNFATMNNLINGYGTNLTMTEGNLKASSTDGEYNNTFGTILMQSGKWYWEITSDNFNNYAMYGVAIENAIQTADSTPYGQTGVYAYATHGEVYNETASSSGSYTSFLNQEIIGIAVDLDASPRTFKFYNNNTLQGTTNLSANFNVDLLPIFVLGGAQNAFINFGQDSSFAGQKTAQGNTDGNGIGDFYYAPPSGHLALCSANLPEPNIGPDSPTQADDHFNTVLYTGNGGTGHGITGVGFQPDWTWIKGRSNADYNYLVDSNRGYTERLFSNLTDAASVEANTVTQADSDGFTIGSDAGVNRNSSTYVAWNWKANGGTTSSNSDGTITSTVQANTTAGFSIVTYTGNGSFGATVGHGLGAVPKWYFVKSRTLTTPWAIYHQHQSASPEDGYLLLNLTDAFFDIQVWNDTAPTSSVFSLGGSGYSVNNASATYVAYCFAEIEGYSKFGSYTGNGNADGTYVYTGFRPAWIMFKRTDSTNHWLMLDNKRNVGNPVHKFALANTSDAEDTSNDQDTDFTSNGFKVRNSNARNNASGGSYVYMAFAEQPFKFANAR